MLTGDKISLFLDKDAIAWGEDWRDKIDSSLASIAFFIPVITPRYFMSPECRRELQFFARRATRLGIKELVLPLLYVDFPSIHDDEATDDLIALVRTFQWEDWTDLRFADVGSGGYRRGVARLAARLVNANRRAEESDIARMAQEVKAVTDDALDDSLGLIDRLATAEETLPKWGETLEAIRREIELIRQVMQEATDDIHRGDAQGRGFAYRLIVARRLANGLGEPAERVWSLGNEFASQLHDVDEGFRALIERAPAEIQENPNSKAGVCDFFEAVRGLSASARGALESTQKMIDSIAPLEKVSRDLRPALRRLRRGLTILVEAREVTDEWVRLIESSGVICEAAGVQAN